MKTLYYSVLPIVDLSVTFIISNDNEGLDEVSREKVSHAASMLKGGESAHTLVVEILEKRFGEKVELLPTLAETSIIEARNNAKLQTNDEEGMGIFGGGEDT